MGKGGGMSHDVQEGMLQNSTALTKIAQGQAVNADQLYHLTEPGLNTAEDYYQSLATGDPSAIMRAISPAASQISESAAGARKNILENTPAGGEKGLALEMADAGEGSQIGQMAANAYLQAPNALASLAGQGVGESISAVNAGTNAYNASNSGFGNLGNLQIQQAQLQAQQKGGTLSGIGQLAGTAAMFM